MGFYTSAQCHRGVGHWAQRPGVLNLLLLCLRTLPAMLISVPAGGLTTGIMEIAASLPTKGGEETLTGVKMLQKDISLYVFPSQLYCRVHCKHRSWNAGWLQA